MVYQFARSISIAWAALVLQTMGSPALSQSYPSKAVRVVVGFPAGAPADTMARIISKKMNESGYRSVRSDSWYGVAVPVATSPDLVQRMNKLWVASLRTAETRDLLYAIGVGAVGSSTDDFQAFRTAEGRKWGDLIRKMNLKLE